MAATTTTKELFDNRQTSEDEVKALAKLRLKAGAITSKYRSEGTNWVLISKWNLFGQQ